MTIRELYQDAIIYGEPLLRDIILLLVLEKQKLKWDDPKEELERFLNPPEEKKDAWNAAFRRELEKMRAKRKVKTS